MRVRAVNDRADRIGGPLRPLLDDRRPARRGRTSRSTAAIEHAGRSGWPLLVFEPLRAGYPWASARVHQFVLDGMHDNARAFDQPGVTYFPYVEPQPGDGQGLLEALAADAAVVVTDDFPCFFLPRMVASAAAPRCRCGSRRSTATACCRCAPPTARSRPPSRSAASCSRRWPTHIGDVPDPTPFARAAARRPRRRCPTACSTRWPDVFTWLERGGTRGEPADRSRASRRPAMRGGATAARAPVSTSFIARGLARYVDDRNDPGADVGSGLSPYLHFGHLSPHEVFAAVMAARGLARRRCRAVGRRRAQGWWGVSPAAEAFLDQLVTWRELGFNMCAHRADYDQYASLPGWALATLARHADDPRDPRLRHDEFDAAAHRRPALERRPAPAAPRGPHPQLPADAVGQEDPAVVADAARTRWRR